MTTLQKPKGILLVVSGPSGTGKGTVNGRLMELFSSDYCFSVSATTREPRCGEVDGVNYHYITKDRFKELISSGEMLEHTEFCGNYYGTPKSELKKTEDGKNLILEIEVEGAMNIKRLYPDCVTVFILPPDYETLERRLSGRGTESPEVVAKRMNRALSEFPQAINYDYTVVNPDGEADSVAKIIHGIVTSEKQKTSRISCDIGELFRPSKG